MITLRGITWDHPRGLQPLVATAALFEAQHPDVHIDWEVRSLHAFGAQPIDVLAQTYDLLVIDHPFVGVAAKTGCLLNCRHYLSELQLVQLEAESVGPSHRSYRYHGQQWALAIDAAAQVSAYRPDLFAERGWKVPATWDEVVELATSEVGSVALPLTPVNAISCFLTLCAHYGEPPMRHYTQFVERAQGETVLYLLARLGELVHPCSFVRDPPGMLDALSSSEIPIAYVPLIFGYSNYARQGFRAHLCHFVDMPVRTAGIAPQGSLLGGAGIAVSAACATPDVAMEYTSWLASTPCQRAVYVQEGGQPANRLAWTDPAVNALTHSFFANTLATLELAYLRPRYPSYPAFQDQAGTLLWQYLSHGGSLVATLDALDTLYRESIRDIDIDKEWREMEVARE